MICIIDIDSKHSRQTSSILTSYSIENIISTDERKITYCDKIIIPDSSNISASLRKIKLMNLLSVLRLVKKPILGINQGMILMCRNIQGISKMGLGLIEEDALRFTKHIEGIFPIEKSDDFNENKSLSLTEKVNYFFRTDFIVNADKHSESILKINGKAISAVYKQQNIFGILMCLDNNENTGEDLLLNFAELNEIVKKM